MKFIYPLVGLILALLLPCCKQGTSHDEMVALLQQVKKNSRNENNSFSPGAKLEHIDSLLSLESTREDDRVYYSYMKANILLELGEEAKAISILQEVMSNPKFATDRSLTSNLAIAFLRQGERTNCISNHAAESCILPIKGVGIHRDPAGSQKAIELYKSLLERNPTDLESRWLLNVAYMTLGTYPQAVPKEFLIPGMEGDTTEKVNAFIDVASDLGLDVNNMAGGSITDDFDNDGFVDFIISAMYVSEEMHYFRNNGNGTFTDVTEKSGLKEITGGLNICQADYNNDGFKDILVLRGGWQRDFGNEPNSLLRNNGDGTFTDVTTTAGLLSFHPTQTATWNDFNNDGWLDLFIGNESMGGGHSHPCELYINNGDGTFREIAKAANCNVDSYVKGVTSGDFDNDGYKDLFLSTMSGKRMLLRNVGIKDGEVKFEEVSKVAGIADHHGNSFPTWFWDFDNDGLLDIFACDYTFKTSLGSYFAAEKLGIPQGNPEKTLMYHNNGDGTFTNVAEEVGMNTNIFAMGSNFGDIDNDGFLDMYLGTGNPPYQSAIPNRMFKNQGGKHFADVTASARVGHLQKGHAVSFADIDNDGDQDIYIEMGGAFPGDAYQNAFFLNPGQGNNNWITIDLEGVAANRSAIGSRVIIHITENGKQRKIYRDVNSGGSFGSSPLRREIGIGQATKIDKLEILWHGGNGVSQQIFENVEANQFIKIKQGEKSIRKVEHKKIEWNLPEKLCGPIAMN